MNKTWLYLLLIPALPACAGPEPSEQQEASATVLLAQLQTWHCQIMALHQKSVALWDGVVTAMDEKLPAEMPPDERHNMLAVRNTGLIQMFELYPTLPDTIHQLVEGAGMADQELAAALLAAQDSLAVYDSLAQALLISLHREQSARYPHWRDAFNQVGCPTPGSQE